jgi:hypothetical protein
LLGVSTDSTGAGELRDSTDARTLWLAEAFLELAVEGRVDLAAVLPGIFQSKFPEENNTNGGFILCVEPFSECTVAGMHRR